ncbi:unnamed protein product [Amoebophrya sp. A120]|nr:unnamed protein product [Amoebophrya sp. A120]|eukprot:GSA120T00025755001.1
MLLSFRCWRCCRSWHLRILVWLHTFGPMLHANEELLSLLSDATATSSSTSPPVQAIFFLARAARFPVRVPSWNDVASEGTTAEDDGVQQAGEKYQILHKDYRGRGSPAPRARPENPTFQVQNNVAPFTTAVDHGVREEPTATDASRPEPAGASFLVDEPLFITATTICADELHVDNLLPRTSSTGDEPQPAQPERHAEDVASGPAPLGSAVGTGDEPPIDDAEVVRPSSPQAIRLGPYRNAILVQEQDEDPEHDSLSFPAFKMVENKNSTVLALATTMKHFDRPWPDSVASSGVLVDSEEVLPLDCVAATCHHPRYNSATSPSSSLSSFSLGPPRSVVHVAEQSLVSMTRSDSLLDAKEIDVEVDPLEEVNKVPAQYKAGEPAAEQATSPPHADYPQNSTGQTTGTAFHDNVGLPLGDILNNAGGVKDATEDAFVRVERSDVDRVRKRNKNCAPRAAAAGGSSARGVTTAEDVDKFATECSATARSGKDNLPGLEAKSGSCAATTAKRSGPCLAVEQRPQELHHSFCVCSAGSPLLSRPVCAADDLDDEPIEVESTAGSRSQQEDHAALYCANSDQAEARYFLFEELLRMVRGPDARIDRFQMRELLDLLQLPNLMDHYMTHQANGPDSPDVDWLSFRTELKSLLATSLESRSPSCSRAAPAAFPIICSHGIDRSAAEKEGPRPLEEKIAGRKKLDEPSQQDGPAVGYKNNKAVPVGAGRDPLLQHATATAGHGGSCSHVIFLPVMLLVKGRLRQLIGSADHWACIGIDIENGVVELYNSTAGQGFAELHSGVEKAKLCKEITSRARTQHARAFRQRDHIKVDTAAPDGAQEERSRSTVLAEDESAASFCLVASGGQGGTRRASTSDVSTGTASQHCYNIQGVATNADPFLMVQKPLSEFWQPENVTWLEDHDLVEVAPVQQDEVEQTSEAVAAGQIMTNDSRESEALTRQQRETPDDIETFLETENLLAFREQHRGVFSALAERVLQHGKASCRPTQFVRGQGGESLSLADFLEEVRSLVMEVLSEAKGQRSRGATVDQGRQEQEECSVEIDSAHVPLQHDRNSCGFFVLHYMLHRTKYPSLQAYLRAALLETRRHRLRACTAADIIDHVVVEETTSVHVAETGGSCAVMADCVREEGTAPPTSCSSTNVSLDADHLSGQDVLAPAEEQKTNAVSVTAAHIVLEHRRHSIHELAPRPHTAASTHDGSTLQPPSSSSSTQEEILDRDETPVDTLASSSFWREPSRRGFLLQPPAFSNAAYLAMRGLFGDLFSVGPPVRSAAEVIMSEDQQGVANEDTSACATGTSRAEDRAPLQVTCSSHSRRSAEEIEPSTTSIATGAASKTTASSTSSVASASSGLISVPTVPGGASTTVSRSRSAEPTNSNRSRFLVSVLRDEAELLRQLNSGWISNWRTEELARLVDRRAVQICQEISCAGTLSTVLDDD